MDLRDRKTTKPLIILAYMQNTTEGKEKKVQQIMTVMRNDHYYKLLSIFSLIVEMTYQYLNGVYARVHNCFFSLPVTQK